MKTIQQGFTLIELMIVVAIIAIIVAIAMPSYQDYLARTQLSEAITLASGSKTLVSEFYSNTGRYPPDNASVGAATAASITGKYVESVSIVNGQIRAHLRNTGVAENIQGEILILSPVARDGSVEWHCSGAFADKYKPTACR